MARIRNLALLDIPKINKLVSFLDVKVKSFFDGIILPYPITLLHNTLPLRLKLFPESYVLFDGKELLAYISLKKHNKFYKKWKLSKLLLANNSYNAGLTLVQYAVSKLAAKGATSFIAEIEETQNELIGIFTEGAGFRHCLKNQLWKYTGKIFDDITQLTDFKLRPFKNSDIKEVSALFNESLLPYCRPTLNKEPVEFQENFFAGLSANTEFRYVLENKATNQIVSYFLIKTGDNKHFVLDMQIVKGYEHIAENIVAYGLNTVKKRTKDYVYYVLNRQYLQTSLHYEYVLKKYNLEPQTSSVILVKDLFRTVKAEEQEKRTVFYTDINSTPAFKSQIKL